MQMWMITVATALAQMPSDHPAREGMDWQVPAAVLVGALLIGFLVVSRLKQTDEKVEADSRRLDLLKTQDEVVEALNQLEVEKSKIDPAHYETERKALIARGARAMAVLDGADDEAATPETPPEEQTTAAAPIATAPPAPAPAGGLAPEWRGALYALIAVGLIGGFIWFAQQGAKPRGENMGMTGGDIVNEGNAAAQGENPMMQSPQFKASVNTMKSRLEVDPNDLEALNNLTQLYFTHGDPATAMEFNTQALELEPKSIDARVYRAVLSAMMSMPDRAIELLDEVIAEAPEDPKAVTYRGLILMELSRFEEAVVMLEKAVQMQPSNKVLTDALNNAIALRDGKPLPTPTAASGDLIVAGTITLDPSVKLSGMETIFVSVSDPARPGPPVAADKLGAGSFPQAFELTTADIRAMPGQAGEVPDRLTLKVRVDLDGNAMTKEAAPQAILNDIPRGAAGVGVVLTMDGTQPTAAPAPAAPTGKVLVSGTATLGDGAAFNGNETLFINIKDPAGGPPLAADKRVGVTFPYEFQLTDANVINMMGAARPIPASVILSVRLDKDGNAMTKDGEPGAAQVGVAPGTTGLQLTLQ